MPPPPNISVPQLAHPCPAGRPVFFASLPATPAAPSREAVGHTSQSEPRRKQSAAAPLRARKGLQPLHIAATASLHVETEQDSRDDTWSEHQMNVLFESASRLRLLSNSSMESLDAAGQLEHHVRTGVM